MVLDPEKVHISEPLQLPAVYPILDTATMRAEGFSAVDFAAALLEGGARVLQFRHKAFWSREVVAEASGVARLCREAGVAFVVNDRADYAAYLDAGVHLGQEDLLPRDARAVIGKRPIGFSTHNAAQVRAAQSEPVDYVAFGPVFPTGSKDRPDPVTGIAALREARALTAKPLVAIGGITPENAALCWEAGADSVAVISGLIPHSRALLTKMALRTRMEEWLKLAIT
jgi:thiamine-phosphate pyrophosphorylase